MIMGPTKLWGVFAKPLTNTVQAALTGSQGQEAQLFPCIHPCLEPAWQAHSSAAGNELPVAHQHTREVGVHHAP